MSGHDCLTQEEVRAVECPACGAPAGEPCREYTGAVRPSNHLDRVRVVKRARAERAQQRKLIAKGVDAVERDHGRFGRTA